MIVGVMTGRAALQQQLEEEGQEGLVPVPQGLEKVQPYLLHSDEEPYILKS